ncbi:S1C family serine protease [Nitrosopumilus maritimus]|uniref:2-alkenal reductase n=1 Tax=Nitrosopumilus maritimus (strain SCM1) TaxID=436308 RepID=A9A2P2_NITMS|nr:trypsin-like peptidase domain-containing protein [Nitrosopumilus maritimus]ABX13569.1 2-alkenal reductase [Nitrosopumilus maritimus SCM1]
MYESKISLGGLSIVSAVVLVATIFSASFVPGIVNVTAETTSSEILDSEVRDKSIKNSPDNLSLTQIFEQSESGIVSIAVTKSSIINSGGVGSGFVYDDTGNIITNSHVVENAKKIIVTFIDGRSYNAKVVGTDAYSDLAVIKINVDESILDPLILGNSDSIKVGERVTAIGNPYGLSGSMTAGIVSQIGRLIPSQNSGFTIPDVIQTDAAINPGNSGGPLLNMKGDVVGVTTAIYSRDGGFSGVGFAIPSNTVNKIIPFLIKDGSYNHPWVGITSINITPDIADILELEDATGIMIMNVVKDGPADKSDLMGSSEIIEKNGIQYTLGGDVILAIDDVEVRKVDDLITHLQKEKSVGDTTTLKILRDDKIIFKDILLEKRPD